jgi:hypothetical protein
VAVSITPRHHTNGIEELQGYTLTMDKQRKLRLKGKIINKVYKAGVFSIKKTLYLTTTRLSR